jgi:hypothetical protein
LKKQKLTFWQLLYFLDIIKTQISLEFHSNCDILFISSIELLLDVHSSKNPCSCIQSSLYLTHITRSVIRKYGNYICFRQIQLLLLHIVVSSQNSSRSITYNKPLPSYFSCAMCTFFIGNFINLSMVSQIRSRWNKFFLKPQFVWINFTLSNFSFRWFFNTEPKASTARILILGFCSFKNFAVPIVPPVPLQQ